MGEGRGEETKRRRGEAYLVFTPPARPLSITGSIIVS
jgi:hypothetical protein